MTLTLDNYKTFDNVADLNEAIRLHLREHKYSLNATAFKTLEVVSRHAVKYPGAAWLKIDSLTALIGKSAPTVRRALALLERLGIIERVAFMRPKRGGNGGNILRIVAADRASVIGRANRIEPTEASVEQAFQPTEAIDLTNKPFTRHNITLPAAQPSVYERIQEAVKDRKLVREYMKAFKANTTRLLRFSIHADKVELFDVLAMRALHITLRGVENRRVRKPVGYFTNTLRNMIDQALFSDMSDLYSANPEDISLGILPY